MAAAPSGPPKRVKVQLRTHGGGLGREAGEVCGPAAILKKG
jgi:hypothetical protein